MIVGMIGFILVVFLLYASMLPSDEKNSGSSSSTFLLEVLTHPETAGVIAVAAAMAAVAVKTCGLPLPIFCSYSDP